MPPDEVEIGGGKALFAPVAGGGDDRLVFADHLFEIFDLLDRHRVLVIAKVDIGARVGALLRDGKRHRAIVFRRRGGSVTGSQEENDEE